MVQQLVSVVLALLPSLLIAMRVVVGLAVLCCVLVQIAVAQEGKVKDDGDF